jgi:hypothetical protein
VLSWSEKNGHSFLVHNYSQGWIEHDLVGGGGGGGVGGALPALVPSCVGHVCRSPINLLHYCKVLLDYCIWIVVHSLLIIMLLLKLLYLIPDYSAINQRFSEIISGLKQATFLTTRTAWVSSEDWVKGCDWWKTSTLLPVDVRAVKNVTCLSSLLVGRILFCRIVDSARWQSMITGYWKMITGYLVNTSPGFSP